MTDQHTAPSAAPSDAPTAAGTPAAQGNRRQVLYWRLLARLFDPEEQQSLESASFDVVAAAGLPGALLDPQVSVDTVVQRHPELAAEFDGLMLPGAEDAEGAEGEEPSDGGAAEVRRAALVSKVLLNVFATGQGPVTAEQLARWQSDAGWLERALGCRPGELRGGRPRQRTRRQPDRHRRRDGPPGPQPAHPIDRARTGRPGRRPGQAHAAVRSPRRPPARGAPHPQHVADGAAAP